MRTLNYAPEVVFRGKIDPGTFTIDAPNFECTIYTADHSAATGNFIAISGPLNRTFTVTRERAPKQLLVPRVNKIGPTTDWISVKGSEETLGFGLETARDLTMFCRASRSSSSKEGVSDISISGKELATPIVIGPSDRVVKDQTGGTVVYPGFLVELKRANGNVRLGISEGSANIELGMTSLTFMAGSVSTVQIREPSGSIKIATDDVKQLTVMDELRFGGKDLEILPGMKNEITVQGQSRDISLNGVSLGKSILPKELDITNLIGELFLRFLR